MALLRRLSSTRRPPRHPNRHNFTRQAQTRLPAGQRLRRFRGSEECEGVEDDGEEDGGEGVDQAYIVSGWD